MLKIDKERQIAGLKAELSRLEGELTDETVCERDLSVTAYRLATTTDRYVAFYKTRYVNCDDPNTGNLREVFIPEWVFREGYLCKP